MAVFAVTCAFVHSLPWAARLPKAKNLKKMIAGYTKNVIVTPSDLLSERFNVEVINVKAKDDMNLDSESIEKFGADGFISEEDTSVSLKYYDLCSARGSDFPHVKLSCNIGTNQQQRHKK